MLALFGWNPEERDEESRRRVAAVVRSWTRMRDRLARVREWPGTKRVPLRVVFGGSGQVLEVREHRDTDRHADAEGVGLRLSAADRVGVEGLCTSTTSASK